MSLIVFTITTIFSIGLTSIPAYAAFLTPVEIIDVTGDGGGNPLTIARGIAIDSSGNVFVTGYTSNNVFQITPGGVITEIIDVTGDGSGNTFNLPFSVATDLSGNVFVTGETFNNVFKISTPGTCSTGGTPCIITEIIDVTGDGGGNPLFTVKGIAIDSSGNVFVTGFNSNNAFKISTPGTCSTGGTPCIITEIIDVTGDGGGNPFTTSQFVTTDSSGNVFVTGFSSNNVFKISAPGTCSTGGTPCTITEIIDSTGDGAGNPLLGGIGVTTDSSGNFFVTGFDSDNAFKISTPGTCSTIGTPCTITEIIDIAGDGGGNPFDRGFGVTTDLSGNVFVTGQDSNNAFKIAKDIAVGGTYIPIDNSALLLAGVQSISMWMIPVVIIGAGIGIFVIKRRK